MLKFELMLDAWINLGLELIQPYKVYLLLTAQKLYHAHDQNLQTYLFLILVELDQEIVNQSPP